MTLGSVFVNKEFVMGLITINFVVEIIVTPILSMPVAFAVDKFLKRNRKQVVTDKDLEGIDIVQNDENLSESKYIDGNYDNIDKD